MHGLISRARTMSVLHLILEWFSTITGLSEAACHILLNVGALRKSSNLRICCMSAITASYSSERHHISASIISIDFGPLYGIRPKRLSGLKLEPVMRDSDHIKRASRQWTHFPNFSAKALSTCESRSSGVLNPQICDQSRALSCSRNSIVRVSSPLLMVSEAAINADA